jgi:hypothetical protein
VGSFFSTRRALISLHGLPLDISTRSRWGFGDVHTVPRHKAFLCLQSQQRSTVSAVAWETIASNGPRSSNGPLQNPKSGMSQKFSS